MGEGGIIEFGPLISVSQEFSNENQGCLVDSIGGCRLLQLRNSGVDDLFIRPRSLLHNGGTRFRRIASLLKALGQFTQHTGR